MKTKNGKSYFNNIYAIILAIIGIAMLSITWLYHISIQLIVTKKENRLNPFNKSTWIIDDNYPNGFCYWFCNIEATMISHLCKLRVEFDNDYCHEDDVSELKDKCNM